MASATAAGRGATFFPSSQTRRRHDLPTLVPHQQQQPPTTATKGALVLPPTEQGGHGTAAEGPAKAAAEGVNRQAYYPPGSKQPTALQKHVSFWDRRKTGVFYPWDTYAGCRALGFNALFALAYALAFHLLHASYWTSASWIPSPFLPVYVSRIHRAKHGSDTGTYDIDGCFHGESFENIFRRYDKDRKGGLTYGELIDMMVGNRNAGDLLGWSFQFFLWSGLWLLAADPTTGVLSRADILRHYDGTLYYEIKRRRKDGKEKLPLWRFGTALSW